jgi:TM2 domain-containing membrane protein YozV
MWRIMIAGVILSFAILLLQGESFGRESIIGAKIVTSREIMVAKDPLLAAILSTDMPGLGQFYCREYLKAFGFALGVLVCGTTAYLIAGEKKWDDLEDGERAAFVGSVLIGIGIYIWNVVDAYRSADRFNFRLIGSSLP